MDDVLKQGPRGFVPGEISAEVLEAYTSQKNVWKAAVQDKKPYSFLIIGKGPVMCALYERDKGDFTHLYTNERTIVKTH
jgi:hypothetical protein